MDVWLRWRSAFSAQAGRIQSALTCRQRGKVAAANAGRHSLRWCVQLGERGDEGRINWHSGGESEGGGSLSLHPSFTLSVLGE